MIRNKYAALVATAVSMLPERRNDSAESVAREDAAQSAFMTLQLQQLEAEIYRQIYPDLMWRSIMPVKNSGLNPGAESFAWVKYNGFGIAKFFANMGKDLPTMAVKGEKFVSKVEALGDAYRISVDELLAASMANLPLESEKAQLAAEAVERLMDETAAQGDSSLGFFGFFNQPSVTIDTVATVSAATTWAAKLALSGGVGPTLILNDLHAFCFAPDNASKGKIKIDRLVMSQSLYNVLATTQMSTTGFQSDTILAAFLKTSPYIKSESQISVWYRATNMNTAGTGDRIVGFKYDRKYMEAYVPKELEVLPAQPEGFEWIVPMWAKFGGLVLRLPPSMRYLDGAN